VCEAREHQLRLRFGFISILLWTAFWS